MLKIGYRNENIVKYWFSEPDDLTKYLFINLLELKCSKLYLTEFNYNLTFFPSYN